MSAVAHVLLKRGYQVSGSDLNAGHMGAKLAQEGALVYMGHAECQVDDVDAVVISSAIHQNNPELVEAKKRNLLILHRSDVLAEIINHADGVAVAGAHGKTTTSAMISCIAAASDIDPTIIIGGEVRSMLLLQILKMTIWIIMAVKKIFIWHSRSFWRMSKRAAPRFYVWTARSCGNWRKKRPLL